MVLKQSFAVWSFQSLCAVVIATAGLTGHAKAADLPAQTEPEPSYEEPVAKDWEFVLGAYGFLPWISGDAQTGPVATDFDLTGSDVLNNLKFTVMADAEIIYRGRFTAAADLLYASLGTSSNFSGNRKISVALQQTVLEGRLGYRMLGDRQTWLEAYAGVRYWDVETTLSLSGPIIGFLTGTSGDQWVDPIIGLRGRYAFTRNWALVGRGDIGGFGAGSDFTWNLQGGVQYAFDNGWAIDLQYKALAVDFDNNDPGLQRFAIDDVQQGPLARISYRF